MCDDERCREGLERIWCRGNERAEVRRYMRLVCVGASCDREVASTKEIQRLEVFVTRAIYSRDSSIAGMVAQEKISGSNKVNRSCA